MEMFGVESHNEKKKTLTGKLKAVIMAAVIGCSLVGVVIVKQGKYGVERRSQFTGPHGGTYQCSVGMYIDPQGCLYCPKGNFCNQVDLASPKQCGVGTYQDKIGQKACPVAPAGKYADKKGMIAAKDCAAGSFQPNAGQTSCILAPAGTFVPVAGQKSETNCPPQFYQPTAGQTSCLACGAGEVQPLPGQSSCMCSASNTSSLAAPIRTNTLAKLTHLAATGCPGSLFLRGGDWYVGSARTCTSGKAGVGGRAVNVSSLWMVTAIPTTNSERPEYAFWQSGSTIYTRTYYCNYVGSCSNTANWQLTNQNRFHVVFPSNVAYKKYTAMVPSYAQALSWAKQGYAPAFRIVRPDNNWYYFDYMTAMWVQEPGKSKQYTFYGTFPNQWWLSHNVRFEIFFQDGVLKHCCRIYSGTGRACTGVNGKVSWFVCKTSNFEFNI